MQLPVGIGNNFATAASTLPWVPVVLPCSQGVIALWSWEIHNSEKQMGRNSGTFLWILLFLLLYVSQMLANRESIFE